uniref:Uncharacterized protein n=1 Tax=Chelydra serpentina TaxID=8475 RepID=A0A8C3SR23_CHESE
LLPLVSPVLLFALLTIWVILSPCDILAKQTRLFLWMVGVVFSNVICRVIICQMSDTRSEAFHWLLFPLALVVYAAVTGLLGKNEEMALTIFTTLATAAHIHYGVCVSKMSQITKISFRKYMADILLLKTCCCAAWGSFASCLEKSVPLSVCGCKCQDLF